MPTFQVSPGVAIREIDLTTVVPSVSTTEGAIAGIFRWGPVDEVTAIDSEKTLSNVFGKPTDLNAETYFTAANFLAYSNQLFVVRVANTTVTTSAIANTGAVANLSSQVVRNRTHFDSVTFDANTSFVARYPGQLGNNLKISVCDSPAAFESTINLVANSAVDSAIGNTFFNVGVNSTQGQIQIYSTANASVAALVCANVLSSIQIGDVITVGNSSIGRQYLKVAAKGPTANSNSGPNFITSANITFTGAYTLATNFTANTIQRNWEFFNNVNRAPGTSEYAASLGLTTRDEMHVVVIDEDGGITNAPGTVLEVFESVSRGTDNKLNTGASYYYKNVINNTSKYIYVASENANALSNTTVNVANSLNLLPRTFSFTGGSDGNSESNVAISVLASGYDKFASAETYDISFILQGKARGSGTGPSSNTNNYGTLANYIISNICETRKDCILFVSPAYEDVVNALDPTTNLVAFRNNLMNSSYYFLDSGYKYQYDKYTDTNRWIPLNGDIAGLSVRTDSTNAPWFSPAGFNRGQIKNIIKLGFNPTKFDRDIIYKRDINPVVTFPGQGTILYGDKTGLGKPSAFDRINVRRLFIVLEKAISTAAKFTLFEFNDEFTRAQFRNLVEPYLREVKGRRGIFDFKVVCDETNNTPDVIDRNEFIGDIYIKPARSINYIQLNFVAVRTGVEFNEIVGRVG